MSKLAGCPVTASLPAQDVGRLKKFYESLGFQVEREDGEGGASFKAGNTSFYVFQSMGRPSGDHTQMSFEVTNMDEVMAELREAGVTFETYDMPDFKTDANGVLEMGDGSRAAWFKDPEGNVIALGEGM